MLSYAALAQDAASGGQKGTAEEEGGGGSQQQKQASGGVQANSVAGPEREGTVAKGGKKRGRPKGSKTNASKYGGGAGVDRGSKKTRLSATALNAGLSQVGCRFRRQALGCGRCWGFGGRQRLA